MRTSRRMATRRSSRRLNGLESYGAEARWNVNSLQCKDAQSGVVGPLQPGHVYRVQVLIHDGDQNGSGGDAGQSCSVIAIPPGKADLVISKTDGVATVSPSGTTTYTITVVNNGPHAVPAGAILSDPATTGLSKTVGVVCRRAVRDAANSGSTARRDVPAAGAGQRADVRDHGDGERDGKQWQLRDQRRERDIAVRHSQHREQLCQQRRNHAQLQRSDLHQQRHRCSAVTATDGTVGAGRLRAPRSIYCPADVAPSSTRCWSALSTSASTARKKWQRFATTRSTSVRGNPRGTPIFFLALTDPSSFRGEGVAPHPGRSPTRRSTSDRQSARVGEVR